MTMFTTPCFIRKNTPELRSKLENIGYHRRPIKEKYDKYKFLLVYRDGCYNSLNGYEIGLENYIDCGYNEKLFLAIAALRDDTDKYQLFLNNKDTECKYPIECIHDEFHLIQVDAYMFRYEDHKDEYHKGTAEELIKHFKNK